MKPQDVRHSGYKGCLSVNALLKQQSGSRQNTKATSSTCVLDLRLLPQSLNLIASCCTLQQGIQPARIAHHSS